MNHEPEQLKIPNSVTKPPFPEHFASKACGNIYVIKYQKELEKERERDSASERECRRNHWHFRRKHAAASMSNITVRQHDLFKDLQAIASSTGASNTPVKQKLPPNPKLTLPPAPTHRYTHTYTKSRLSLLMHVLVFSIQLCGKVSPRRRRTRVCIPHLNPKGSK